MGAVLPGNSTVELRDFPIPEPGHGQVLLKTKSSTICGSDIRAIYREHLGKGPEGYQNKIAGHEPCGQIVAEGPGLKRFKKGDRVIVYHISGCGVCNDCRRGYMISCTSSFRAAYGWQRDGGMAPLSLPKKRTSWLSPMSFPIRMAPRWHAVLERSMRDLKRSVFPETTPSWLLAWAQLALPLSCLRSQWVLTSSLESMLLRNAWR